MSYTNVCSFMTAAALGISILGLAGGSYAGSPEQRGGGQNRDGGGGQAPRGGAAPNRGGGAPPPRTDNGGQVHARRDAVRTPNYVPRPAANPVRQDRAPVGNRTPAQPANPPRQDRAPARNRIPAQASNPPRQGDRTPVIGRTANPGPVRRPRVANSPVAQVQRKFSKTASGRVYDNGLRLRKGVVVTASWQKRYFPKGHFHYPYYRPAFVKGQCFVSPFGFYFGVCVPYIASTDCHVYPPSVVFVDTPIYNGVDCSGFQDAGDNLLSDPNLDQDQPGLGNAVDELTETFQSGNIDGLVALIDPNTSIAVYFRGHYKYSMPANDYVDMTRDVIKSMQTVQFSLQYLRQRAPGVFSASGEHSYRDQNGQVQTMWVSFVLQDISGQWTLTQVETAPAHYHKIIQ